MKLESPGAEPSAKAKRSPVPRSGKMNQEEGKSVKKILRWASIGAGAGALALGLSVPAVHASATTKPISLTQQSRQSVTPASCTTSRNYKGGSVTFTPCTGHYTRTGCGTGNNGAIYGPLYAANGCQTQLFLWLSHTTSGTPDLCVNPTTSTNTLKKYYEEFKVTSNTGHCGS